MKQSEIVSNCLLCNGKIEEVISFGNTPLANELMTYNEAVNFNCEKHQKFDLTLMHCLECGHCQLKTAVNEDRLYKFYCYVSGTNATNVEHFKKYAQKIIDKFYNNDNKLIIEIASNDGTFLKFFDNSFTKIGIDPAKNLVEEAAKNGVKNIPVFFNESTAKNEINEACNNKKANVIVANNVFAHNKDLKTILDGVKFLLDSNGTFVFENSYLLDILDKKIFDLIYHEHIHHHSIMALTKFFNSMEMKIYDVERLPNHGGSIRVYSCHKSNDIKIEPIVYELLNLEISINNKLKEFKSKVDLLKNNIVGIVNELKNMNKKIGILGFPAKATTLLHYFNLSNSIDYVYDDNPLKQNLYAPGTMIRIQPTSDIYKQNPDVLIVLAWNFADDLINKHKNYKGKFIIPLPELIIK